jgi:CyaY protein
MNEAEFHQRAAATLRDIERAVEDTGADIDFENAGDILTLDFVNGSKIIINKQSAAFQLWVAARAGGFHYNYDAVRDVWVNDQNGNELYAELARLASEQAGSPVDLGA